MLVLMCSFTGVSQINSMDYFSNLENVNQIQIDSLVKEGICYNKYIPSRVKRKVDFGFEEWSFRLYSKLALYDYQDIILFSKDGEIVLGLLGEIDIDNKDNCEYKVFKKEAKLLHEYINKHNEFYSVSLTEKNFLKDITRRITIGGKYTYEKETEEMFDYVETKNRGALHKMMTSFSFELQTLGAIGIMEIGDLTKKEQKLIEYISNRESKMNNLEGCILEQLTFKEIYSILKK